MNFAWDIQVSQPLSPNDQGIPLSKINACARRCHLSSRTKTMVTPAPRRLWLLVPLSLGPGRSLCHVRSLLVRTTKARVFHSGATRRGRQNILALVWLLPVSFASGPVKLHDRKRQLLGALELEQSRFFSAEFSLEILGRSKGQRGSLFCRCWTRAVYSI